MHRVSRIRPSGIRIPCVLSLCLAASLASGGGHLAAAVSPTEAASSGAPRRVPVIYSTDLFHPHDDPDDHYDLASLFALPEIDVLGIVIDMANSGKGTKAPGVVALRQVFAMTGRRAPWATGLEERLRSPEDPATDRPAATQRGVELILDTLRSAKEPVTVLTTGSLLDVAAALNREPRLLRTKVRALHINVGTGPDGEQTEWNVRLAPHAYRRVIGSRLPIEWYPCFGRDGFLSWFRVDQTEVLQDAPARLRAYFAYALSKSTAEPIAFLEGDHPPPRGPRNMWCTPSFVEVAGRQVYRTSRGYEALAAPPSPSARPVSCYRMRRVAIQVGAASEKGLPILRATLGDDPAMNVRVIERGPKERYEEVMGSVVENLLESFPARDAAPRDPEREAPAPAVEGTSGTSTGG